MAQTIGSHELLQEIVRELAEARRSEPSSEMHYSKLSDSIHSVARAVHGESSECVREACIEVAVSAIRLACEGCQSLEPLRTRCGLDPLTAHIVARSQPAAVAHQ